MCVYIYRSIYTIYIYIFTTNPTYRQINPSESEIEKISKHILS